MRLLLLFLICILLPAPSLAMETPRGFYTQLEFIYRGQRLSFGPFVGYYFKPRQGDDLTQLEFRCYNERQFYTDELKADMLLFKGEAVLVALPRVRALPRSNARIEPVFFDEAPVEWLQSRPSPQNEFVHFHSAYDATGASYSGYWLRHQPVVGFIYNMGGRVDGDSPLYHKADPDKPHRFPHIIEFDNGPRRNTEYKVE